MKKIVIEKNSIVMTIGPSNSGKSFFCNMLINQLTKDNVKYCYLSSDDERRNILNNQDLNNHDYIMNSASKGAFSILHNKLNVYTSFPINTPVVIIDTTNLSNISRSEIEEYAIKNNYNLIAILFDYKDKNEYYKYATDKTDKKLIGQMVYRLRKETIKEINKLAYKHIYRLDTIDFSNIEFKYNNDIVNGYLETQKNVCIVADLHGCYEEFIEMLLDKKGIELLNDNSGIPIVSLKENEQYIHHILVGDIVDKGSDEGVTNLINFIHKNKNFFTIVKGNHEEWNYKYLTGVIKDKRIKRKELVEIEGELVDIAEEDKSDNQKLIENYFTSVKLFQNNEDLKSKFIDLYENNMYYYVYNDKYIITHAPCKNEAIGKEDTKSLKKMSTCMYPKNEDFESLEEFFKAKEEFFRFLIDDSEANYPYHIFGHVMVKNIFTNKNKIGLDLGCVVGGYLATAIFMEENRKPFFRKYKSRQTKTKELYELFRVKQNLVKLSSLEFDLQKRLKWCAKNKINFISGTMSPVNKDLETNNIESLSEGIKYYLENNVTSIMLQPKFMGSRCNMLLHINDITKCKSFSRNAYEINNSRLNSTKTLEELYAELQTKYKKLFEDNEAEFILLDGELLPWNAMGKDLIERDFMVTYKACNSEHKLLREYGFEETMFEFEEKYYGVENENDLNSHEKRMLKEYLSFENEILSIDETQMGLDRYKRQIDLFGSDGILDFKAFSILKIIKSNGTEENWINGNKTNLEIFKSISNEPYCYLNITNDGTGKAIVVKDKNTINFESYAEALLFFWKYITTQKEMEGVVIKPNSAYLPGIAPYLKCRNSEYLRLTYGFDYDLLETKTERLLKNKSIKRKLETSIKEYELGRQLLDIPMNEISIVNNNWLALCVQLINEQLGESTLDPRL